MPHFWSPLPFRPFWFALWPNCGHKPLWVFNKLGKMKSCVAPVFPILRTGWQTPHPQNYSQSKKGNIVLFWIRPKCRKKTRVELLLRSQCCGSFDILPAGITVQWLHFGLLRLDSILYGSGEVKPSIRGNITAVLPKWSNIVTKQLFFAVGLSSASSRLVLCPLIDKISLK